MAVLIPAVEGKSTGVDKSPKSESSWPFYTVLKDIKHVTKTHRHFDATLSLMMRPNYLEFEKA